MTALKASLGWRGSDVLLRTHHTRTGPEEKRVPLASASSKGVHRARLAETTLPPSSAACSTATSGAPCPGRSPGSAAAFRSPRARQRETSRHTGGSGGVHTASAEISPSLTCGNHVQHGKQVLTSTTIISPNSCPRLRSAQACLCNSPRDAHSAIAPPIFFFENMRGQPQISSPSLGGVGVDLGLDSLTMSGLVPDKFNSEHNLPGCAESWRACAVSPWVLKTVSKGYVLQFARSPPPFSRVIQSV